MPLNPCKKCGEKNIFQDRPKVRIVADERGIWRRGKVTVECPCGEKVGPCNNFEQAADAWNA
jgi:hypothetical protein